MTKCYHFILVLKFTGLCLIRSYHTAILTFSDKTNDWGRVKKNLKLRAYHQYYMRKLNIFSSHFTGLRSHIFTRTKKTVIRLLECTGRFEASLFRHVLSGAFSRDP